MPRPIIYSIDMSPPCRAVLLVAEAIGLDLEIRQTGLLRGDHLTEEFVKMNPQHTIPTLDDNGDIIWDSHAINCYLVGKYAKNDSLYPRDLKKRALIDQRLHFDTGVLFALLRSMARPLFYDNKNTVTEEKITLVKEAYDFLNKFLEGKKWLAGDSYTLADISCITDVGSLDAFAPYASYPNVVSWVKTCEKELPGYATIHAPGNTKLCEAIKEKLAAAS